MPDLHGRTPLAMAQTNGMNLSEWRYIVQMLLLYSGLDNTRSKNKACENLQKLQHQSITWGWLADCREDNASVSSRLVQFTLKSQEHGGRTNAQHGRVPSRDLSKMLCLRSIGMRARKMLRVGQKRKLRQDFPLQKKCRYFFEKTLYTFVVFVGSAKMSWGEQNHLGMHLGRQKGDSDVFRSEYSGPKG